MILENLTIPQTPGCYLFKDSKGKIIYVGKSKFLPKRVKSYFQKNHEDIKTRKLVEKITSVEFVICESESESLIVEENLIKLYQPEYNIKGKDDKTTRQVLIIADENYPRVTLARNTETSPSQIVALFTSSRMAREVWEILHQVFPLRSCTYNLSQENISSGKFQACLEWHIKNCLAPCINDIKLIKYQFMIRKIRELFNFDYESSIKYFKKRINHFSKKLEFERAAEELSRLNNLKVLIKKIEPLRLNKIRDGLEQIGKDLKLSQTPLIIEAFDNSHTSGIEAVSASVRYVMGHPEKSSYRKYIIKSGSGANDYGSFREVLHRRFKRLLDEGSNLPNLVIIDGDYRQLSVAIEIFSELKITNVDLISVSKDKNHKPKTIHTTNGGEIDIMTLEQRNLLASITEEVHRFVITFHRHRRDKIK